MHTRKSAFIFVSALGALLVSATRCSSPVPNFPGPFKSMSASLKSPTLPPDDDAGCTCSGESVSGPVTVNCGDSTCGSDYYIYDCTSSGWAGTGQYCTSDPVDAGSGCSCSGMSVSGEVTVSCGNSVCGPDDYVYNCSASGWAGTSQTCTSNPTDGGSCTCSAQSIDGPVTVNCGQTTCGSDGFIYDCSASGWSGTSSTCTSDCYCFGQDFNGNPVALNCGETTCGTDDFEYTCGSSGWTSAGQTCSGQTCQCSGQSVSGAVSVNCGSEACGTDDNLYNCTATGWSYAGQTCTTNPPPTCACTGTSGSGPVTVDCGETLCGTDGYQYSCGSDGWTATGGTCG